MQAPRPNTTPVTIALEVVAHWRNESRSWSDSTMFDSFRAAATHFQLVRQQANVSRRDTLVDLVLRQHRRLDLNANTEPTYATPPDRL